MSGGCRYCGKMTGVKRIHFSLRGNVSCCVCHLAHHPTVGYLLDALAIAQWEGFLAEQPERDHIATAGWTPAMRKDRVYENLVEGGVVRDGPGLQQE